MVYRMRRQLAGALGILSFLLAALLLLFAAVRPAYAELERVGPLNTASSVGSYPAWYQDSTGLAIEFCDPKNQAEVDGGWCLLGPADVPVAPEVFPTAFADEHFYYSAEASLTAANGGNGLLVLAVEAAFAEAVQPGDQMVFSRIRVKLTNVPVPGTYRFIHPYGEEVITCPADCRGATGNLIFSSDDVGITPLQFEESLTSRLGPFLLPSNTPGGAELAAVPGPVPGKLYIADPGRSGPVTGSSLHDFVACPSTTVPCALATGGVSRNHNIFRIEGPIGSNLGGPGINFIETTNFSLIGRIFQGPIPGRVTVDRATYERPSAGPNKIDVFTTAFSSTQGRLPAGPPPAVVVPQITFFDGPCFDPITGASATAGLTSHQMFFAGTTYWGQSTPTTIPSAVCVVQTNALAPNGQFTSALFEAPLVDRIDITEALYNPAAQSLSVKASSSDVAGAPTLTLVGFGDLVNGQILISPLVAPPAKVRVRSSGGGYNELQVSTAAGATPGATPGGPGVPVALNDSTTVAEDSAATSINVLTNDTVDGNPIPAGATINVVATPQLGAAVASGTAIAYTPRLNAIGTDVFTYTVTVNGVVSNQASVTVTITNANDPPTANNDSATAVMNTSTQINVLSNDADLDGQADIAAVANLTQPTPAGASVALQPDGRTVNFMATATGAFTFTYQAQDAAGALSNVATVTVTVTATATAPAVETITITRAESRANGEVRIRGLVSNFLAVLVVIHSGGLNAAGASCEGPGIGIASVDPVDGSFDFRTFLSSVPTTVCVESMGGGVASASVTVR